ncbi:MAG TPA: protein kinase [Gemmatimonadaceae bacterium]
MINERLNIALAGRYRIERELGQGGMATVYLAQDLKHDRKVALKVLKPELAAVLGADRFVVEIRTTASLQHPHILPLFDSGTADGFLYYVMPFIEGETLRDKLNRETQLGVDEAVRIAREVADALDYAHGKGVIHRDIKPENILIQNGRPMVADFGIALAVSAAAGGRMTETGLSLGTPHYMSPEQATADKEITGRSDVYSLASVLYEMLAGVPPHEGGSAQQTIMRIITDTPRPVSELRKSVPPNVAAAVARALEKLPADRFAGAKEFSEALVNPAYGSLALGRSGVVPPQRGNWRERVAIPAIAIATVFALITAWSLSRTPSPPPVARYRVVLPDGKRIGPTQWSPMAVSPDGSKLVYVGESGRLLVRSRDDLEPAELPGTDGAFNPFFSPTGTQIGFMSGLAGNAEIRVVSLTGGPPRIVTSTGVGGPGASWSSDGFIYFDASGVGPLMRVRETGGPPEAASTLDSAAGELQHDWPDALPNGRGVIVTINRGGPGFNISQSDDIGVIDVATKKHRVVVHGIHARYAESGHIVYLTAERVLMAVPFDQDRLEVTGNSVPLIEGINVRMGAGGVDFALSRSGTLWYSTGRSLGEREALWVTREGAYSEVDSGWRGDFESLALSPNARQLAVSLADAGGEHIWVKQLDRPGGALSKLTHTRSNQSPRWHPDGRDVLFQSMLVANSDLRSARADASSPPRILYDSIFVVEGRWTPDLKWLVVTGRSASSVVFRNNIYGIRPGVDSGLVALVATDFSDQDASVSPDGRWLLYSSNNTGTYEAYVRPFPGTSVSQLQVSTGGGRAPKWSSDGREIFFRNDADDLIRVPVLSGADFAVGPASRLFSLANVVDWDVAPGAQRFVVIRPRGAPQDGELVVVEGFNEELKKRVPR